MLKKLAIGIALGGLLAGAALAETHEIKMLNKGEDGTMVFEPAFIQIATGDTVKFLASDKGHNAESVPDMIPEGAEAFKGKINEEIEVTLDVDGVYAVKCLPHYSMGMVMTIAVGEGVTPPDGYLEGRIPKRAKDRFSEQLENL
ncbi:pseudoazurin [Oceaniglobus ichthyenteri]|uniref:pseudoazurin n=1 Tax=Oceaniglobus ichthyenteri TaxID=2136177 RepID=UPI000D33F459|nr:pseudoazurin [Oceaniglobus ichthyenteri]